LNQIGCQCGQPFVLVFSEAIFNCDVLALDEACCLQTLAERSHAVPHVSERSTAEKPHHRLRRLLRTRRERPCGGCAGNPFDEIASSHAASRELTLPIGGKTSLLDDRRPSVDLRLEMGAPCFGPCSFRRDCLGSS